MKILLLATLFWALWSSPLAAQVATASLDPSHPSLLPAALAWRDSDEKGEPTDQISLNVASWQTHGLGGDDAIDWNGSGQQITSSFTLGPVRVEPWVARSSTDLLWLEGASHCGQVDEVYNCSHKSAGGVSHQQADWTHLNLALPLGPLGFGLAAQHQAIHIDQSAPTYQNSQNASLSLRLAGLLYLAGGVEQVERQRLSQAATQFNRNWAALAFKTNGFAQVRIEAARGQANYAHQGTDLSTLHPDEERQRLELELKMGRFLVGLHSEQIQFAEVADQFQVERSSQLRRLTLSWVPQKGYQIGYQFTDHVYAMELGGDPSQEGRSQQITMGLRF
ncbi:MAG: hypothetical protein RRB13_05415 [bacterium]|nr:hypothetical protein [bacterium]